MTAIDSLKSSIVSAARYVKNESNTIVGYWTDKKEPGAKEYAKVAAGAVLWPLLITSCGVPPERINRVPGIGIEPAADPRSGKVLARAKVRIEQGEETGSLGKAATVQAADSTNIEIMFPGIVDLTIDGTVTFSELDLAFVPADEPLTVTVKDNDTAALENAFLRIYLTD